jgi:hypothetical protein
MVVVIFNNFCNISELPFLVSTACFEVLFFGELALCFGHQFFVEGKSP